MIIYFNCFITYCDLRKKRMAIPSYSVEETDSGKAVTICVVPATDYILKQTPSKARCPKSETY